MPSYEVIKPCYVALGRGLRYTPVGKIVTLEVEEAEKLDGYIRPVGQETVQFLDTEATVEVPDSEPTVHFLDSSETIEQEVIEDVGDPSADHE